MTYEFKLPDIGEGVVEGEVVRWLVSEGEMVREDQPLVEIMTDKATVEIPAPKAGRIGKRMYAEGQICPVGKMLVTIETDAAAIAAVPSDQTAPPSGAARIDAAPGAASVAVLPLTTGTGVDAGGSPSRAAVLATPATRKLARDLGVDIRQVSGSGPAGRITSDDVRAHTARGGGPAAGSIPTHAPRGLSPGPVAPKHEAGDVRLPFRGVRKKIAERLVHSKHTAAHFTYVEEIDCTDLVARSRPSEPAAVRARRQAVVPAVHHQSDGCGAREVPAVERHAGRIGRRDCPARRPPHRPCHRDGQRPHRPGDSRRRPKINCRFGG